MYRENMSFIGFEGAYFGGPCDYLVDEDDVTSIAIRWRLRSMVRFFIYFFFVKRTHVTIAKCSLLEGWAVWR